MAELENLGEGGGGGEREGGGGQHTERTEPGTELPPRKVKCSFRMQSIPPTPFPASFF